MFRARLTWLLVVASLNAVHGADIALSPCYATFRVESKTQEYKFDSSTISAGANLNDCMFTLIGPNNSTLKLFFHDVQEMDPVTGTSATEPLCIDGAVRIYEMTSDGDLHISDAVCQSMANSTEVTTTYNIVVVTSTITSGRFGLTVAMTPGVPTVPKVMEDDTHVDTNAPQDEVFEDATTAKPDKGMEQVVDAGLVDGSALMNLDDALKGTTVMPEEAEVANDEDSTTENSSVTTDEAETENYLVTTEDYNAENDLETTNDSMTENYPVTTEDSMTENYLETTDDSITVEAAELEKITTEKPSKKVKKVLKKTAKKFSNA